MSHVSVHDMAVQTNYEVLDNVVSKQKLEAPTEIYSWPFLKGVDVKASGDSASIAALGDSITDGYGSTRNANTRWPDLLARRLQAKKKTSGLSVLNEGIAGNRYAVTSHSSQGLTAERVLVHADTSVHPDLLNSRFGYVSISRASHEAILFTDDLAKLGPQLGADVSKTSALEINRGLSAGLGIGLGL